MSLSRVTYGSMSRQTVYGLQQALGRTQQLQAELSSGKRVSRASDDPAAADTSMKLRSEAAADDQYMRNADSAGTYLNATDSALQSLADRLQRVRELLVNSANGGGSDSAAALSSEAGEIHDDVVSLYNTRVLDRPLFGGTVAGPDAIDSTGTYVGDDQPIYARVSKNTTVRVDTTGTSVGADTVPALIAKVATDLVSSPANRQSNIDSIDAALKQVTTALSDNGARTELVTNTRAGVASSRQDLSQQISDNEDADLPETIMNLQSQQIAYQSALGAASKVLTQSLVDYLR